MTIYEELIQKVREGSRFNINFETRTMKIGKKKVINNGEYGDKELISIKTNDPLDVIENLYSQYKFSIPSERSENKRRGYFKALSANELTDEELICGERREVARARLEGFILCMILNGKLTWDEFTMGKWFWQSRSDDDLVILRKWIDGNKNI